MLEGMSRAKKSWRENSLWKVESEKGWEWEEMPGGGVTLKVVEMSDNYGLDA